MTGPSDVPPSIYLNDGKGHFTSGDPSRLPALLGTGGFDIYPAAKFIDLNHDGRLHLFLGSGDTRNNPHDLLLLNDGHGFFSVAPDNALPTRYGGRNRGTVSARVVDMDGDGWPDLVNAVNGPGYCEGAVQILLNNHDGTFRDATNLIAQPAWPRSSSPCSQLPYVDPLYTADFNGDGLPDILVHGNSQPSRLFLSTGTAGGGRLLEATELLPHTTPAAIAVADFNGDGALDIAAWINCCNSALRLESWLRTRSFQFTPDLIPPSPNGPSFLRGTVLNSADFTADALAPGQLVSIFGTGLGPDTLAVASPDGGSFPTQLAGTRVLFNNAAAPVLFTSAGAVGAIVPFSALPGVRSDLVVENQGTQSPPVSIFVDAAAPAMFTADGSGAGAGAVQNFDPATGALTLNTSQNPVAAGGLVIAYITGGGATNPPSVDGALATSAGQMMLPVLAALDFWGADSQGPPPCGSSQVCQAVNVLYAGPAPGLVAGVTQVNVRLPDTASAGSHFLGVMVRGVWTQWLVTIWVR